MQICLDSALINLKVILLPTKGKQRIMRAIVTEEELNEEWTRDWKKKIQEYKRVERRRGSYNSKPSRFFVVLGCFIQTADDNSSLRQHIFKVENSVLGSFTQFIKHTINLLSSALGLF